MSGDYAVWASTERLSTKDAGALYVRLCDGELDGIEPSPAIAAFYAELVAKHPEIEDISEEQVDDEDLCPWSCAFDRSEGHIVVCAVWSKADYVGRLVESLAAKHGLVFYDPQSERVVHPGGAAAQKPWWKVW